MMLYAQRNRKGDLQIWKDGDAYQLVVKTRNSWDRDEQDEKPPLPEPDLVIDVIDQGLLTMEILRGPMGYVGPMGAMGRCQTDGLP